MIAALFELDPRPGTAARCFELAAALKADLASIDGLVPVERFESLARPGHHLFLSFWRDAAAVRIRRCHGMRRQAQQAGRGDGLAACRLRVATVARDDGMLARDQAPPDSQSALI